MVNSSLRGALSLEPGKITRPVTRVRDFEIGTNCSETYVRFSRNHSISLQFIHTAGSLYTDVPSVLQASVHKLPVIHTWRVKISENGVVFQSQSVDIHELGLEKWRDHRSCSEKFARCCFSVQLQAKKRWVFWIASMPQFSGAPVLSTGKYCKVKLVLWCRYSSYIQN